MKAPQIDIFSTRVQAYLSELGWKNKFLRLWGTEMLDGVEVLKEKKYFYPYDENNTKIFAHLGMLKQLKNSSHKGLKSAWIYLNPTKYVDDDNLDEEVIVNRLEFRDSSITTELIVAPRTTVANNANWRNVANYSDPDGLYDENKTEVDRIAYLKDNWQHVLDTYLVTVNDDYDQLHTFTGLYGPTVSDSVYVSTITKAKMGYGVGLVDDYHNMLLVTVSTKDTGILTKDDPLVIKISDAYAAKQAAEDAANQATYQDWMDWGGLKLPTTDPFIWYKDRLRASVFTCSTGLPTSKVNALVSGSIDVGYQKKSVPFWKTMLGIAAFILGVWWTGGSGAAFVTSLTGAATGSVAFVATQIVLATLAVNTLSAAMTLWGDNLGAAAVGKFAGIMGKLSMFMGVINVINNVMTSVQAALEKAAEKTGIDAVSTAVNNLVDDIVNHITTIVRNYTVNLNFARGLAAVSRIFKTVTGMKLKSLQHKLRNKESTLEKLKEEADLKNTEEALQQQDMARQFSKIYTEQIQQDQGMYEIDYLYEPTEVFGKLNNIHIGNICRRSFL